MIFTVYSPTIITVFHLNIETHSIQLGRGSPVPPKWYGRKPWVSCTPLIKQLHGSCRSGPRRNQKVTLVVQLNLSGRSIFRLVRATYCNVYGYKSNYAHTEVGPETPHMGDCSNHLFNVTFESAAQWLESVIFEARRWPHNCRALREER
jgi:hypothetical protein